MVWKVMLLDDLCTFAAKNQGITNENSIDWLRQDGPYD